MVAVAESRLHHLEHVCRSKELAVSDLWGVRECGGSGEEKGGRGGGQK